MLVTTAGSQQVDQKYWLDRKTGMSYRINVYTPQPQLTSVKDLMTVPVGREQSSNSRKMREMCSSSAIWRRFQQLARPVRSRTEISCR